MITKAEQAATKAQAKTVPKRSRAGRNLVVFCDGTGNELGRNLSNVLKLYRVATKSDKQLCYYSPGVGTISRISPWSRLKQKARGVFGLMTGYGLDDNVLDAYRFLVDHWRPGDQIYLFGFSRGAWTVRVLAGMLHLIGLLKPQQDNMCDSALGTYKRAASSNDLPLAWHFSRVIGARAVPVHFVGVWDTVASMIVPRPDRFYLPSLEMLPYTKTNPSVAVFRHAIAIDERRRMFRLAEWEQPQTYRPNPFDGASEAPQDIRQVCFAGVHSDVGGGYPEEESALSKIPLAWMIDEAQEHGLLTNKAMYNHLVHGKPRKGSKHQYTPPDPAGPIHPSLSGAWWALEFLPKNTKFMQWPRKPFGRWYLPKGEPRRLPSAAEMHPSVEQREAAGVGYEPVNIKQLPQSSS